MRLTLSEILMHSLLSCFILICSISHISSSHIYRRLSRSWQLGGIVPVFRRGVPLRCKASKLWYPIRIPPLVKERTLVWLQLNTLLWWEGVLYYHPLSFHQECCLLIFPLMHVTQWSLLSLTPKQNFLCCVLLLWH